MHSLEMPGHRSDLEGWKSVLEGGFSLSSPLSRFSGKLIVFANRSSGSSWVTGFWTCLSCSSTHLYRKVAAFREAVEQTDDQQTPNPKAGLLIRSNCTANATSSLSSWAMRQLYCFLATFGCASIKGIFTFEAKSCNSFN